ncbi:4Fe-4S single cluster domain-containing protein [Kribbella sp. NPDC058693]|uniref:4Fe-4S single cluster domain-containing protein n=1 Tax=Kribbella sp. NPDC058693 TaxID=3346602 RepID=UPI00365FA886
MTTIAVNRLHHPVTVLGHGVRAGIWVQGCSLGCHGCMSRDTWVERPESAVEVSEVVAWVLQLPGRLDGVTISGGEPFEQPQALAALLGGLREATAGSDEPVDLLVYSGYAWSRLARTAAFRSALGHCDAVVAGPYVERRNTAVPLRGSDNQVVVPLTELGHERYGEQALERYQQRRLQASVVDGRLWLVGIPRREALRQWEQSLESAGVIWEGSSWNA